MLDTTLETNIQPIFGKAKAMNHVVVGEWIATVPLLEELVEAIVCVQVST